MKTLDDYYEAYAKGIFTYIYAFCHNRAQAEDIVQETFYRAYLCLNELQDETIKAWLYRVAYNTFIDYVRKERRSSPQEPAYFLRLKASDFSKRFENQQELLVVFQQIEALPFQQKQALLLSSVHALSYGQIAGILEVSEASVKSLIFRARATLKRNRKGEGSYE